MSVYAKKKPSNHRHEKVSHSIYNKINITITIVKSICRICETAWLPQQLLTANVSRCQFKRIHNNHKPSPLQMNPTGADCRAYSLSHHRTYHHTAITHAHIAHSIDCRASARSLACVPQPQSTRTQTIHMRHTYISPQMRFRPIATSLFVIGWQRDRDQNDIFSII